MQYLIVMGSLILPLTNKELIISWLIQIYFQVQRLQGRNHSIFISLATITGFSLMCTLCNALDPASYSYKQFNCKICPPKGHTKNAGPYFVHKYKHLSDHNRFAKIDHLRQCIKDNKPNHILADDLYTRLIATLLYSGSKLKRFPPAPYSPTIAKLRNIQRLLKLAVTQHKTNQNTEENISRTKAKLGNAGYQLPPTLSLCMAALAQCTRQLKATIQE